MRILVTGADGQLGRELLAVGRQNSLEVIGTALPVLDITDYDRAADVISRHRPALVINSAAYTDVDKAESEPETAFKVNRDGPVNLARICADRGLGLIHLSTDYVFDGRKRTPYLETDPISPLGVYAQSKAAGEQGVRTHLSEHIIIRTSWLYGVYGRNFVKTMLRLGRERGVIRVVNDQLGSPTSAREVARAVFSIIAHFRKKIRIDWGTYHFCGGGISSWYEFAVKIFDLTEPHRLFDRPVVQPVASDSYPTPAKRPAYSVLDCTRIQAKFGITQRPWQRSLETTLNRILSDDAA